MILIPKPKSMRIGTQTIVLDHRTLLVLDKDCDFEDFKNIKLLKNEMGKITKLNLPILKALEKIEGNNIFITKQELAGEEQYKITASETGIEIVARTSSGIFYAIQTFIQIVKSVGTQIPYLTIEDEPYYKFRGYFQDITRGKIPNLESLKRLADKLAKYKYNQLQIYVEHSFAFRNQTEVWFEADPITAEEILELDLYCKQLHIELVPAMATFGHLYTPLKSESFKHLCELDDFSYTEFSFIDRIYHHTLNISNEGSFRFICDALDEFIPLFSSDKFNICGDETHDLCKHRSRSLTEKSDIGEIYVDFVTKIISHIDKYDKKVMMWGDIIGKYPQYISKIPSNTIFLNWQYTPPINEKATKLFYDAGVKQYVCPSTAGWNRMMNDLDMSFQDINELTRCGEKYKAIGELLTDWGDYGHMNFIGNSIPSIIYNAALAWNTDDDRTFEEFDKEISLLEYGDRTESMVRIMRKIGNSACVQWDDTINWYEWKFIDKTIVDEKDHMAITNFMNNDTSRVRASYYKAIEGTSELLRIAHHISSESMTDFEQVCLGTRGIGLLQSLYLNIRKFDKTDTDIELIHQPEELAVLMEQWFIEYSNLWRKINKESELFRLREMFKSVCKYLRKVKNNKISE